MPGCLGLDAMWQLVDLSWLTGEPGKVEHWVWAQLNSRVK